MFFIIYGLWYAFLVVLFFGLLGMGPLAGVVQKFFKVAAVILMLGVIYFLYSVVAQLSWGWMVLFVIGFTMVAIPIARRYGK